MLTINFKILQLTEAISTLIIMKYFKILFIAAACLLSLVPLDATAIEIYYFNHPTCASAEYKGDVLEIRTKNCYRHCPGEDIEDFVNNVKENVASQFGANIICGGKLESSFYSYLTHGYRYESLTMTFTGTAMKKL